MSESLQLSAVIGSTNLFFLLMTAAKESWGSSCLYIISSSGMDINDIAESRDPSPFKTRSWKIVEAGRVPRRLA